MIVQHDGDFADTQAECEQLVFHASELLRFSGRRLASAAVIELVRTAPRSEADVQANLTSSLFDRCMVAADERVTAPSERERFRCTQAYFSNHLAFLPPCRRAELEAIVRGVLLGYCSAG